MTQKPFRDNFPQRKRVRRTPAQEWQLERRMLKGVLTAFVGFTFRRAHLRGKSLAATPAERARITEACGMVMRVLRDFDESNGVSKACWFVEHKEGKDA